MLISQRVFVRSTGRKRFSCSVSDSEFKSIETYNSIVKLKKSYRFCRGQLCKTPYVGYYGTSWSKEIREAHAATAATSTTVRRHAQMQRRRRQANPKLIRGQKMGILLFSQLSVTAVIHRFHPLLRQLRGRIRRNSIESLMLPELFAEMTTPCLMKWILCWILRMK